MLLITSYSEVIIVLNQLLFVICTILYFIVRTTESSMVLSYLLEQM